MSVRPVSDASSLDLAARPGSKSDEVQVAAADHDLMHRGQLNVLRQGRRDGENLGKCRGDSRDDSHLGCGQLVQRQERHQDQDPGGEGADLHDETHPEGEAGVRVVLSIGPDIGPLLRGQIRGRALRQGRSDHDD